MLETNCESVSPLHCRKKPRFFCPCLSGVFIFVRSITIIFLSSQHKHKQHTGKCN